MVEVILRLDQDRKDHNPAPSAENVSIASSRCSPSLPERNLHSTTSFSASTISSLASFITRHRAFFYTPDPLKGERIISQTPSAQIQIPVSHSIHPIPTPPVTKTTETDDAVISGGFSTPLSFR